MSSFPRLVAFVAIVLFSAVALLALFKGDRQDYVAISGTAGPVEVSLDTVLTVSEPVPVVKEPEPARPVQVVEVQKHEPVAQVQRSDEELPVADRIAEFFNTRGSKLPFIETLVYKARVEWQEGRPAWLSDYARHYKTSRHFIARSLNGKPDYFKQDVAHGDKFNVFRQDKEVEFYLVIDTSRCKMWFYAYDKSAGERTLVKTYDVGLGRIDNSELSGLLTPLGRFSLGDKVAIYKPGKMGLFNGAKTEMVRVFGTRWIPFAEACEEATSVAAGLGIHGVPWLGCTDGELAADNASIGKYESDGCIRLATPDMEELFAIVITKPTTVELVRDFYEAHLPGVDQRVNKP